MQAIERPLWQNFNPRLPCGRRLFKATLSSFCLKSPPPMRGGDKLPVKHILQPKNPRLPCGRRLKLLREHRFYRYFNPRLPCGRRPVTAMMENSHGLINPRLPCGRRPECGVGGPKKPDFQSPPPMREATRASASQEAPIQSPPPMRGGDRWILRTMTPITYFNPPPPHAGGD